MKKITKLVVLLLMSVLIPSAGLADVPIAPELALYFTPEEIAEYEAAMAGMDLVPVDPNGDPTNRLTNPGDNRCGNTVLPVNECPTFQELAWNGGAGCITELEYNYAMMRAIAPICKPFDSTAYLGWCRCGCFEKSTTLRVRTLADGQEGLALVSNIETDTHQVFALTEDSTLSELDFEARDLFATTVGDEDHPLVWVHLENGVALGLTREHAVLLSSGIMVTAVSLVAGDSLVAEDGQFVSVTEIVRAPTADPVYNVLTDAGLSHKGHMVVANGIVVGDIMWQNTLAKDLGDVVVRM